jgi:hypothetical protein
MLSRGSRALGVLLLRKPPPNSAVRPSRHTQEGARFFAQQTHRADDVMGAKEAAATPSAAAVCEQMSQLLKAGDIEGVIMTYR